MIARMPTAPELLPPPRRTPRQRLRALGGRLRRVLDQEGRSLAIGALVVAFVVLWLWRSIFISIDSGHAGVRWSRFTGTVTSRVYGEGMAVIFPWDRMYVYPLRLQAETDSLTVLTSNGLSVNLVVTTRFQPNPLSLPLLHKRIGPDYQDKIVSPEVVSAVRETIGRYLPHEVYAGNALRLQHAIDSTARYEIDSTYVVLDEVLLEKLVLPAELQDAIRDKLTTEQAALAYQFRLDAERDEAERKRIEAQGIRAFEQLAGVSILRWRGLAATEALARSPNSKLVVVPTGSESLPLILNP
jgi:regulator of protease activity HflC (stomatin/prohibitin superfamily)